ncbi:hypothetical protein [Flagellimonas allohymeniacidonis]|uniref:Uncharacterized protein n=1 Tax=Flagellimonas allohymeniacidonis TaxID=2517819 RepID=A0A4Q8QKE6_9FLAO|nr:hypothetical protein [Allomuricauda hymeniacidonis]TAI48989.1 hypothetical protein EW142_04115 [Allomuricauda hymeniacidonis]
MGLFDRLKPKKESDENRKARLKTILSNVDINPYDYDHQNMEETEISLKEELEGAVKISELNGTDCEQGFDYVSITDHKDGTRFLYKAMNDPNPRATRDLVNKLYNGLGEDFLGQGEFASFDLDMMESEEGGAFRSWYLTYFDVNVGFVNRDDGISTYLMISEKA